MSDTTSTTGGEAGSIEHKLDKIRADVWLVLSVACLVGAAVTAPGSTTTSTVLLVGAVLSYALAATLAMRVNRYALPLLRAIGREERSYYYEPPEDDLEVAADGGSGEVR